MKSKNSFQIVFDKEAGESVLERLNYLEKFLKKLENDKSATLLKKRIKNEISVLNFDIGILLGDIKTEEQQIKRQEEELNEFEKGVFAKFKERFDTKLSISFFLVLIVIFSLPAIALYDLTYALYTLLTLFVFIIVLAIVLFGKFKFLITGLRKSFGKSQAKKKELKKRKENLKKLKIHLENAHRDDSMNDYGFHSQNRDWLEEKFDELKKGELDYSNIEDDSLKENLINVKGRGNSDNKIAKQLSILYWYKFEMKISPDQIKGMVIYKNR